MGFNSGFKGLNSSYYAGTCVEGLGGIVLKGKTEVLELKPVP